MRIEITGTGPLLYYHNPLHTKVFTFIYAVREHARLRVLDWLGTLHLVAPRVHVCGGYWQFNTTSGQLIYRFNESTADAVAIRHAAEWCWARLRVLQHMRAPTEWSVPFLMPSSVTTATGGDMWRRFSCE